MFAAAPMYTLITRILNRCKLLLALVLTVPLPALASLPQTANVPGGIAAVPLASVIDTAKPRAWLGNQPLLVVADHNQWFAVVGLALDTQPGSHELRADIGGTMQTRQFTVKPKRYPVQRIKLKDKGKVVLSAKNLARYKREHKQIIGYEHHWQAAPTSDLNFIQPARGRVSSSFGLRRVFNGKPRAPHAGIDLAVARGTPVKASAAGTVLAADDYFFNGKTVFIDHGNGLVTMYCHLDKFKVKAGQKVRKGQVIALSGMTGRATGPHLHWSVILNGVMVDPELFVR